MINLRHAKPIVLTFSVALMVLPDTGLAAAKKKNTLAQEMAKLKIPPAWYAATKVNWDVRKPWKQGRQEVRRILALGTQQSAREGMKLTYMYKLKGDIGNLHEYPMYTFMGQEYAWSIKAHEEYLQQFWSGKLKGHPLYAYRSMAKCYMHFGAYAKAEKILNLAQQQVTKMSRDQVETNRASNHEALGDLCAEMGRVPEAKQHYKKAGDVYLIAKPRYGRHLMPRRAEKVRAKLDMLSMRSLGTARLRDGSYSGASLGYGKPLSVTVKVAGGKIADIQVKHEEKIEMNATKIIPAQIIKKQSLQVDNITAATVTCDAIKASVLSALRKAGLK